MKEDCYRNSYYIYTISVGDTVIVSEYKYCYSRATDHDYEYSFEFDGEINCESGVRITSTCKDCGYITTSHYSSHHLFTKEVIDVEAFGACSGTVTLRECPCGKQKEVNRSYGCSFSTSSSNYIDDNGIRHTVETYVCSKCGLSGMIDT